jgi:hypothetical protein
MCHRDRKKGDAIYHKWRTLYNLRYFTTNKISDQYHISQPKLF